MHCQMFICNICGRDLKLSGSVSAITAHLTHKHPEIKAKMDEIEQKQGGTSGTRATGGASGGLTGGGTGGKKRPSDPISRVSSSSKGPVDKKPRIVKSLDHRAVSQSKATTSTTTSHGPSSSGSSSKAHKSSSLEQQKRTQVMQLVGFNLPLSHIESPWHKLLVETTIAAARAGASVNDLQINNQEIRKTIFSAYKKLREHFKDQIVKDRILCGVMEQYKPDPKITYSTFRVQWIEDFELFSAVLVVHVSKGHHGKEDFDTKLLEWDVSSSMKFLVTDCPSSDAFRQNIKNSEIERIYCLDHILHLVAVKAFEGILGIDAADNILETEDVPDYVNEFEIKELKSSPLLNKARALVRYFHDSIGANEELMRLAEQLQSDDDDEEEEELEHLVQDSTNKWWPTQIMLERLLALREAITTYVGRQWARSSKRRIRPPKLTEGDWEILDELCLALRPLRFARQVISAYRYPTAPLVPLVVHLVYQDLENTFLNKENNESVLMATKHMLDELDQMVGDFCSRKYKGDGSTGEGCQVNMNKAFLYAHALDPRFKRLSVFPSALQELVWEGILEQMVNLSPTVDNSKTAEPKEEKVKEEGTDRQTAGSIELDTLFQLYAHKQSSSVNKQPEDVHADNWNRKCDIELKRYRETECMDPNLASDVLREWWGTSGHVQYPILWRLVQRYYTIAATSAPASRAFCASGNDVVYRECLLGSDEMLHFLQENMSFLSDGRFLGEPGL